MRNRDVDAEIAKIFHGLFHWYWNDKPQKPILKTFRTPQEIADIIEYESKFYNISETDYINQAILFYNTYSTLAARDYLERKLGQTFELKKVELGDGTKKLNE